MRELSIDVSQYGEPEGIQENIKYALSLNLQELQPAPCCHGGRIAIVGSGPSLEEHIEDIRNETCPVLAVKGAYDYLRERGITPDLYLSVEPRYRPIKNPSKDTFYLLASRVNKKMFDDLKDYPILLWHSWSINDEAPAGKLAIGGGSTSGLRAVNVAYVLGYRKITFYGMDSCLGKSGEKRVGQDPLSDHVEKTDVIVGDESYLCNMAMAAQAQDFQNIYDVMDISMEVKGGGLLAAIQKERQRLGYHT